VVQVPRVHRFWSFSSPTWLMCCVSTNFEKLGETHPNTQAIFTSVASFNAHTKSVGIPNNDQLSLQWAASRIFPWAHNCHRAVILSVWM
jgi:hypothetical protein